MSAFQNQTFVKKGFVHSHQLIRLIFFGDISISEGSIKFCQPFTIN